MPNPNEYIVSQPITRDWYFRVYLHSNFWRFRRERYKRWIGWYCEQHCGRLGTECHHLSYANLYCEPNSDLMLLCRPCHEKMHQWPVAANDNNQLQLLFERLDHRSTG